ncbi:uncharacterized protein G2W53_028865 [Senna tora]|uniref:Uncharacterized protein n=1 Tax=Senna tora TaxID=362788 RepID=A0A834WD74_9FABA|nr:uncharacterized protein G2W53_028865 [Senna tora]
MEKVGMEIEEKRKRQAEFEFYFCIQCEL